MNTWYMVKRYPLYSSFLFQCLGVIFLTVFSLQKGSSQQEYTSPLSLSITFDQWPEESSWDIRIGDSTIVYNADYQYFGDDKDETSIEIDNINLVAGNNYHFNFYDAFIDGICCIQGSGKYTLKDANGTIILTGGKFEVKESIIFNIEGDICTNGLKDNGEEGIDCGGVCTPCIIGCSDKTSHNYNPNAQIDNGSCLTCDDGIINGDESALDCGGALCQPCTEGCMDINSHNYNGEAQIDSGNCETCDDGFKNGDESKIDCGGDLCSPCIESNCDEDEYITDSEITTDMTVEVNETIQSNHKVHSNLSVSFNAGQEIIFGTGFEIDSNTVFEADIGGCVD